jgi:hypothetical protein
MRPLTASVVLEVWERGRGLHPVDRALVLLAAAQPGAPWEQLARLSIGQRDAQLLSLRELTFGPRLASYAECPVCGERLEFDHQVSDFLASPAVNTENGGTEHRLAAPTTQIFGGYTVRFRLPDSFDLAAVASSGDPEIARRVLLERCVVDVAQIASGVAQIASGVAQRTSGVAQMGDLTEAVAPKTSADAIKTNSTYPVAIGDLPGEIAAQIAEQIERADPGADISLNLICPACDHRWQITFDIVTFFWAEINHLAKRLLREVHTLARAYGWREADILAMSAARRQAYLEMVL